MGHFHFPLYYICACLTPHSCKRPLLLCCCSLIWRLLLHCISTVYVRGPRNCPWGVLFLKGQRADGSNGSTGHISTVYVGGPRNCPWGVLFRKGRQVDGSTGQTGQRVKRVNGSRRMMTPGSCHTTAKITQRLLLARRVNFLVCTNVWFDLCCVMTPGLSKDIRCHVWPYFSKLAIHQIRHQATHKVGCQPGDCIFSL